MKIISEYPKKEVKYQRKVIQAIYPQKLVFNGVGYRITKRHPGVSLISLVGKELDKSKNGKELDFLVFPIL